MASGAANKVVATEAREEGKKRGFEYDSRLKDKLFKSLKLYAQSLSTSVSSCFYKPLFLVAYYSKSTWLLMGNRNNLMD